MSQSLASERMFREVQLDLTPEMESLYKLFDRWHTENRNRSLKQHILYFNFRSKIQLAHPECVLMY